MASHHDFVLSFFRPFVLSSSSQPSSSSVLRLHLYRPLRPRPLSLPLSLAAKRSQLLWMWRGGKGVERGKKKKRIPSENKTKQ